MGKVTNTQSPTSRSDGASNDSLALPTGAEKAARVEAMFDRISGRYDVLNRLLTFGLDVRWRRETTRHLGLPVGSRVVDLACGTGDFCRDLERAGHDAIGIDFSAGMLSAARTTAPLVRGDALALPVADATLDGITCGFALRNFVDLEPFFAECARTLRAGGRIAMLEVAEPEQRWLRAGHHFYFNRVVPLIGGLVSDRAAYRYLPESAAYLPARPELVGIIEAAGFIDVDARVLRPGAAQLIAGTRR